MTQSTRIDLGNAGDAIVIEEATRPLQLHPGIGGAQSSIAITVHGTTDHTPPGPYLIAATMLLGRTINSYHWLGELRADDPVTVGRDAATITLRGFISDAQLRAAEEYRGDAEELWIELRILVSGVESGTRLFGRRVSLNFPISSGTWLRAWEQAQAGSYMEVLIPLPGDPEYAKAVQRVREARQLIHADNAEEAVNKARLAIEAVRRAYGTGAAASRARKKESKYDRDKEERWALVVEDLFDLLSGAAHDDPNVTEHFTWTREEAIALTASVSGLVARLAADRQAGALGE
jgi:hypothetical protein